MVKYNNHIFMEFCKGDDNMMKDSAYRYSKIKHQLKEKKERGEKEVVWKLSNNQVEFIKNELHYRVEPCLYEVRTKLIQSIESCDSKLIKEIHYKHKKGIKNTVISLSDKALNLLDEFSIKYRPFKFRIYLNQ